jgi:hypothetical protein
MCEVSKLQSSASPSAGFLRSTSKLLTLITFLYRCRNSHLENIYATGDQPLLLSIHRKLFRTAKVTPGNNRDK